MKMKKGNITMLEQLKSYYKDAIVINEQVADIAAYEWFYTKDGDKIGICKQRLSEQEKQLLSIFLTPIPDVGRMISDEEMAWHRWIIHGDQTMVQHLSPHSPYYRFIHFFTKGSVVNKDDFFDVVSGLFPEHIIIVWEQLKKYKNPAWTLCRWLKLLTHYQPTFTSPFIYLSGKSIHMMTIFMNYFATKNNVSS
jgi:hypothetical protein